MNFIVGAGVLDLPSIMAVSDKFATLLTPADYAFSIWSLIYVLLIIFAVYQARDLFRPNRENTLPQAAGPLFVISSVGNGLWAYVFVNELVLLSVVILLAMTVSLYLLLAKLRIALDDAPGQEIAFVWWPLMLYTGWVSVAGVVNSASWLDSVGVVLSPLLASAVLLVLAAGLFALLIRRNVRELVLASAWGIAAIGVQQLQPGGERMVAAMALAAASVLVGAAIIHAVRNHKQTPVYRAYQKLRR